MTEKSNYSFKIDRERLLEFSKIPVEFRLDWLEDANQLINSITDQKIKNKWLAFKKITASKA